MAAANYNTERAYTPPNLKVCDAMWKKLNLVIKFRPNIFRYSSDPGLNTTLGFTDMDIDGQGIVPGVEVDGNLVCPAGAIEIDGVFYTGIPGFIINLQNMPVRLSKKGNHYLSMPTDLGKDGKRYPWYFPHTTETRHVLTTAMFQRKDVQATILDVPNHPVLSDDAGQGESPFGDEPGDAPIERATQSQGESPFKAEGGEVPAEADGGTLDVLREDDPADEAGGFEDEETYLAANALCKEHEAKKAREALADAS